MNRKTEIMKYVIMAIAVFTCVGFASCVDNDKNLHTTDEPSGPKDFDFSTEKSVEINLKYDVPSGYRVNFEMYTKSPIVLDEYKSYVKDSTLIPFLSGRSDVNGLIHLTVELASTVNEIYAYSYAIGTPVLMKASVSPEGVVSAFQKADVPVKTGSRAGNGPSGTTSWKTYNVTLNKPNLPTTSMIISKGDKELIDKSFSPNQNYDIVTTYYRPSIQLKEKATVKIYSVDNGANSNRTNALAYFVYNDGESIQPDNAVLNLAFPELNKTTPATGAGYKLLNKNGGETFEAGTNISFALFPDITPGNIATTNTHVLYSCFETGSWNTYSYPDLQRASVPHMVMSLLRTTGDGHAIIAISFEDQPFSTTHGTNRGDFRDDTFIIEVDPRSALPDDLPEPPTDEPSYDIEFKDAGILCFEDCWPAQGDYDLNDAVIAYERATCIKNGDIAALKEKYTFLHNGANFINGFGYQLMGAKLSDIDTEKFSVKSDYTFVGQGLDLSSPNEAMVMLFDKSKNVLANTTFTVFIPFKGSPRVSGANPFLVTKGDFGQDFDVLAQGRMEVHLPTPAKAMTKYVPSNKANTSYWGTKDDKSVPASKIYYVRDGNYPFALDIKWNTDTNGRVTDFVIPNEKENIEKTYPEFVKWVTSNGKENANWYTNPIKK